MMRQGQRNAMAQFSLRNPPTGTEKRRALALMGERVRIELPERPDQPAPAMKVRLMAASWHEAGEAGVPVRGCPQL